MMLRKSGCALGIYLSSRDAKIVRYRNFDTQPRAEQKSVLSVIMEDKR